MNRNWQSASLRWLSAQEGGRRQPPQGLEYTATARFFGDDAIEIVQRHHPLEKTLTADPSRPVPVQIAVLLQPHRADIELRLKYENGPDHHRGAASGCRVQA